MMIARDPSEPDWASVQLPDAWPDRLRLYQWWKLVRHALGRRREVEIPAGLPLADRLPAYMLQEFHNLPNGNFSKRFAKGYITGFDVSMLGEMHKARTQIATYLEHCVSVLDVGTAGGRTAATIKRHGVPDVWAIDPSPYLLQQAALRHPDVHFVQATAERTPFAAARFDGIAVCFVFHEVAPDQVPQCLAELRRICKPGGLLVMCEPSPQQLDLGWRKLLRVAGWRGPYFKLLAELVHEPFVRAWHRTNVKQLLDDAGFELRSDEDHFPMRFIYARARA